MVISEKELFERIDQSVKALREESEFSYLEALLETGENLVDGGKVYVTDGFPDDDLKRSLEEIYHGVDLKQIEAEIVRRAFQYALIKGFKEDFIQANHQMTPDSIASFIAYLIEIIVQPDDNFTVGDLSIGTGNLLWTIHNFLARDERLINLAGVDNDELLLSIASMLSAAQGIQAELIHNDGLQNLLLEPVDIMVSDLPVGYYPVDTQAEEFETRAHEGHSYVHHLLIEQGLHYLKEGGFAFFIVPHNLFETEEGPTLLRHIQEVGHMQGMIHLNKTMFQNQASRKSILVLQKQSKNSKQAKEVLLANTPEFNDAEKMKEFLGEINQWKSEQFS